ncbi:MAG: hypothetical protein ABSA46_16405 [Thermodesulfovibrionales bacterium]
MNGNEESSCKEASKKSNSEEDRKEEISNRTVEFWLEGGSSSLFFCFAVFSSYETPFKKKMQVKFVTY